jgi:hypothetical protein
MIGKVLTRKHGKSDYARVHKCPRDRVRRSWGLGTTSLALGRHDPGFVKGVGIMEAEGLPGRRREQTERPISLHVVYEQRGGGAQSGG